jgi:hypothetical protein
MLNVKDRNGWGGEEAAVVDLVSVRWREERH